MKKVTLILACTLLLFGQSCRDHACKDLNNGVYQYPTIPKDHHMTKSEVADYIDLPKKVARCIKTSGLIETCMDYPFLSLFNAGANYQSGYNLVKSQFRGLGELENRDDGPQKLLEHYQMLDPTAYGSTDTLQMARYSLNVEYFEVIIGQNLYLNTLTKEEKVALVKRAMSVYDKKLPEVKDGSIMSQADLDTTAAILARLMFNDQYEPFMQIVDTSKAYSNLVIGFGPSIFDATQKIIDLADSYLLTIQ